MRAFNISALITGMLKALMHNRLFNAVIERLPLERILNSIEYRRFGGGPGPVRDAFESLRRELRIAAISEQTRTRFALLGTGLKLHLGCGPDVRAGWVNVDSNQNNDAPAEDPNFYNFDLRQGVPLPDASASLVYSSHLWEHLSNDYGLLLFRESFRVLEPGGRFRIALPNQEKMCRVYLERDWSHVHRFFDLREMFPDIEPSEITYADFFNVAIYQYGEHVCYYDVERTARILRSVGFEGVRGRNTSKDWTGPMICAGSARSTLRLSNRAFAALLCRVYNPAP